MSTADHCQEEVIDEEYGIIKQDWESIDDLIEYEGDNDEIESATCEFEEVTQESSSEIKTENDSESNANKYYCYDCRTVFDDLVVAEQHDCPGITDSCDNKEKISHDLPPNDELVEYMCAFCEKTFDCLHDLEQHQENDCSSYTKEELIGSTIDEDLTSAKVAGKRKYKNKNSPADGVRTSEPISCNICNTMFAQDRDLKLHMRIHENRPLRRIQAALPEAAAQKYDRLNHFFCEICNKSFDQNLLGVHKNMHQNIEEFICQICNRQFKNRQSFDMHQQVHADDVGTTSSITQRIAVATTTVINPGPTKAALRNAKKGVTSAHLANAKQTFPCQYCGHLFWRPHEKVRHERVHTGEKPYGCEVCGKHFRVPYSLTLHLRTHTDIRPFVCSTCNKRFKSQNVYAHHLRIHQAERSFECDVCGKAFRTSVQLYAHKNTHTKPFNCPLCNRPFASLYAVKAHMKSHSKSKSYENLKHCCNICGATYARSGALKAHMSEQHDIDANASTIDTLDMQEQTDFRSEDENCEVDEAAMLLINAAADASRRQDTPLNMFETNEDNTEPKEYNNEQLNMDFYTEEEVVTNF